MHVVVSYSCMHSFRLFNIHFRLLVGSPFFPSNDHTNLPPFFQNSIILLPCASDRIFQFFPRLLFNCISFSPIFHFLCQYVSKLYDLAFCTSFLHFPITSSPASYKQYIVIITLSLHIPIYSYRSFFDLFHKSYFVFVLILF